MTDPISGCGPGIGRPANTLMHGTRSVAPIPNSELFRRMARASQIMADTFAELAERLTRKEKTERQ